MPVIVAGGGPGQKSPADTAEETGRRHGDPRPAAAQSRTSARGSRSHGVSPLGGPGRWWCPIGGAYRAL